MRQKNKVDEIYVTIFEKYDDLINLFLKYGFFKYTIKETENAELIKKIEVYENCIHIYYNFQNMNTDIIPV